MQANKPQKTRLIVWLSPFLIGFGCCGGVFVAVLLAFTFLQFFLQYTLGGSGTDAPGFWSEGAFYAFIWGSVFGIPLAIVFGLLATAISFFVFWLNRRQKNGSK